MRAQRAGQARQDMATGVAPCRGVGLEDVDVFHAALAQRPGRRQAGHTGTDDGHLHPLQPPAHRQMAVAPGMAGVLRRADPAPLQLVCVTLSARPARAQQRPRGPGEQDAAAPHWCTRPHSLSKSGTRGCWLR